jgi:hypothetical protein
METVTAEELRGPPEEFRYTHITKKTEGMQTLFAFPLPKYSDMKVA